MKTRGTTCELGWEGNGQIPVGHLGALDTVVTLAAGWFVTYLTAKEWSP